MPHRTAAPLHVLVVEDDDDHALLIATALAAHDPRHRVTRVSTGAEAIAWLFAREEHADASPSLVLLDLDLPGVGGHDVLCAIKDDPTLRPLPVVVLTTSDADDDRRRAWAAGANSYLVKPVDYDRFVAMMARLGDYWAEWNRLAPGMAPTL